MFPLAILTPIPTQTLSWYFRLELRIFHFKDFPDLFCQTMFIIDDIQE
jgi:hypothetical protein